MSIFNEIKKNVSDAASAAGKKTSELTGIAKLKVSIKMEKAKLSECYEEIGRLFYTAERSGEDHTSDIATYIMQADKIKANISKQKKELDRLRNIVVCEGCGTEISANAAYCSVCGAKQVKADAKSTSAEEDCCDTDTGEEAEEIEETEEIEEGAEAETSEDITEE